ncbi:MAG TPA: DUF1559 domain-containing protein [Gemmataceae bacterium]|nr:DUF1559 domain-containing protein [Gemmataceae bacterium]
MKRTSTNTLKQIGLSMHQYHDVNGSLPSNYMTKDGKPGLSWRVAILPYMEQDKLFKQFKLDEPWDSDNNLKLVENMPKFYTPVRGRAENGQTFYQMFAGKSTLLDPSGTGVRFANVTDGLSNTFMVVEGGKPVTWTKPDDLPFDGKEVPKLGGMFDGDFHALFGDGSVRLIPKGMDADVLKLLIDRQDGQVIDLEGAIKKAKEKD